MPLPRHAIDFHALMPLFIYAERASGARFIVYATARYHISICAIRLMPTLCCRFSLLFRFFDASYCWRHCR
jgi:hypothetical protein